MNSGEKITLPLITESVGGILTRCIDDLFECFAYAMIALCRVEDGGYDIEALKVFQRHIRKNKELEGFVEAKGGFSLCFDYTGAPIRNLRLSKVQRDEP